MSEFCWFNPDVFGLTPRDGGYEVGPWSAIGVEPKATLANRREIQPLGQPAVVIGQGTIIGTHACIYWDTRIGRDCRFGDHVTLREGVTIGDRTIIGTNADIQYGARIGNDVRVMNAAHISGGTIIGDGSFIGPGAMTANHRSVDLAAYDVPSEGWKAPVLGRNVMVGVGAIILPGVTIGDGAVIAAGALVTRDVAEKETVVGVPARARSFIETMVKPLESALAGRQQSNGWPTEDTGGLRR